MFLYKLAEKVAQNSLRRSLTNLSDSRQKEVLLEHRTQVLIALYVSMCILSFSTIFLLIRLFYYKDFGALSLSLGCFILYFVALIVFIIKTHRLKTAIWLLNLALFVFIPVRTFQTGGIYSPMIFGYIAHTTMAFSLVDQRFGMSVLVWSVVNFAFFSYAGTFYDFAPTIFFETTATAGLSITLMFLVTSLPILFIMNERKSLSDKLRNYDKQHAANTIMHRLAHETGNSLHIALGHLDILKDYDGKNAQHILRIEQKLKEVDEIVKTMNSISGREDLSAFLVELEKDTQIIHALRRKKNEKL